MSLEDIFEKITIESYSNFLDEFEQSLSIRTPTSSTTSSIEEHVIITNENENDDANDENDDDIDDEEIENVIVQDGQLNRLVQELASAIPITDGEDRDVVVMEWHNEILQFSQETNYQTPSFIIVHSLSRLSTMFRAKLLTLRVSYLKLLCVTLEYNQSGALFLINILIHGRLVKDVDFDDDPIHIEKVVTFLTRIRPFILCNVGRATLDFCVLILQRKTSIPILIDPENSYTALLSAEVMLYLISVSLDPIIQIIFPRLSFTSQLSVSIVVNFYNAISQSNNDKVKYLHNVMNFAAYDNVNVFDREYVYMIQYMFSPLYPDTLRNNSLVKVNSFPNLIPEPNKLISLYETCLVYQNYSIVSILRANNYTVYSRHIEEEVIMFGKRYARVAKNTYPNDNYKQMFNYLMYVATSLKYPNRQLLVRAINTLAVTNLDEVRIFMNFFHEQLSAADISYWSNMYPSREVFVAQDVVEADVNEVFNQEVEDILLIDFRKNKHNMRQLTARIIQLTPIGPFVSDETTQELAASKKKVVQKVLEQYSQVKILYLALGLYKDVSAYDDALSQYILSVLKDLYRQVITKYTDDVIVTSDELAERENEILERYDGKVPIEAKVDSDLLANYSVALDVSNVHVSYTLGKKSRAFIDRFIKVVFSNLGNDEYLPEVNPQSIRQEEDEPRRRRRGKRRSPSENPSIMYNL